MMRVLIGEPSEEVRELLVHMLGRLGHEACSADPGSSNGFVPDLMLFEPASEAHLALAASLRDRDPGFPLVACSVKPPSPASRALDPVRHLLKPFTRVELAAAVEEAARACRSE